MNGDHSGFGKLVFRQDIRVPPYQCPQTGSPFAHHCILSSRSMSEYGLFRSRGFCAFFFLGIGMKPRLISLFLSRLCRADLAISSSFQLKYPAGAVGTPSLRGERQQGYCPIMAGVRVRGFQPLPLPVFFWRQALPAYPVAFCGMDVPPGMRCL